MAFGSLVGRVVVPVKSDAKEPFEFWIPGDVKVFGEFLAKDCFDGVICTKITEVINIQAYVDRWRIWS